ncbi:hypothetical protein B0T11DRAFT_70741 [Plectosphaerella cucumerina]|uniref:Uncharacterized protein n=1 Tax=Plectosphaerella cucumerina TaxID=40658 RepID=A0A8K0X6Q5_9PEZI|nr:hypothetical protein B0T11DRAFT_70741 [Plectosphaerella cucumerina]
MRQGWVETQRSETTVRSIATTSSTTCSAAVPELSDRPSSRPMEDLILAERGPSGEWLMVGLGDLAVRGPLCATCAPRREGYATRPYPRSPTPPLLWSSSSPLATSMPRAIRMQQPTRCPFGSREAPSPTTKGPAPPPSPPLHWQDWVTAVVRPAPSRPEGRERADAGREEREALPLTPLPKDSQPFPIACPSSAGIQGPGRKAPKMPSAPYKRISPPYHGPFFLLPFPCLIHRGSGAATKDHHPPPSPPSPFGPSIVPAVRHNRTTKGTRPTRRSSHAPSCGPAAFPSPLPSKRPVSIGYSPLPSPWPRPSGATGPRN